MQNLGVKTINTKLAHNCSSFQTAENFNYVINAGKEEAQYLDFKTNFNRIIMRSLKDFTKLTFFTTSLTERFIR